MPAQAANYCGADVIVQFGDLTLENLGEGDDAVTVAPMTDRVASRAGVGGTVVFSTMRDKRATITVKVVRTGWENNRLQRMLEVQDRSGIFHPMLVKDTRGNELHAGAQACIAAQPQSQHGANATDITWTFLVADLDSNQAGYGVPGAL